MFRVSAASMPLPWLGNERQFCAKGGHVPALFTRHCAELNIRLAAHIAGATVDTIASLAERSSLAQSTLSRNLRILGKAGLIEIATVEVDLRRRAVWLTEQGPQAGRSDAGLAEGSQGALGNHLAAACGRTRRRDRRAPIALDLAFSLACAPGRPQPDRGRAAGNFPTSTTARPI